MGNFHTEIAELLEVDAISNEDVLQEFPSWDSLTALSIIAWADEKHHVTLTAKELIEAHTVTGLRSLLIQKKGGREDDI